MCQINGFKHNIILGGFSRYGKHFWINFITQMRRNYRSSFKPKKEFIHTYHINEVPLPFYNPLEDPNLIEFFSSRKISKQIQDQGFVYKPRREYPYEMRRTKNAYRFHKDNSYNVPSDHLTHRQMSKSYAFSQRERNEQQSKIYLSEQPPSLLRQSQSDVSNRPSLRKGDLSPISRRPFTQFDKKRGEFQQNLRSDSPIFQRKSLSMFRSSEKKNPQVMECF